MRRVLITGTAGFIGFHLAKQLLAEGFRVQGYDGITDYYDVSLKQRRHAMLLQDPNFSAVEGMLEDQARFDALADDFRPYVIVHLAAQAGVRYSFENPRAYLPNFRTKLSQLVNHFQGATSLGASQFTWRM